MIFSKQNFNESPKQFSYIKTNSYTPIVGGFHICEHYYKKIF
jgi:hypothetical protein